MKFVLNAKGFSIVQVLIAAAMMGGLALVISKLSENQSMVQRGAIEGQEINEITTRMQKYLSNSKVCSHNFKNNTLAPVTGKKSFSEIKNLDNNVVFKVDPNHTYAGGISIVGMELKRLAGSELEFEMQLVKKGTKSIGAKNINKKFKLDGIFDGNKLLSCYTDTEGTIATTCETLLGGTYNQTTKKCENNKVCQLEVEMMQIKGTEGTTLCGDTYKLVEVTSLKTSNGSFTIPNDMAGTSIIVKLIGGGGGGGGSDYNEPGGGGSPGNQKSVTFNVKKGESCSWTLGAGGSGGAQGNGWGDKGSGGQDGGSTTVNCAGAIEVATGGAGGCGECRGSGESCGWNGTGVTFAGVTYSGGSSGCRKKDGNPGGNASGGGGAGDRKQRGGNGGKGLVWISYKKLEKQ
jgi:hypothetical protein